MDSSLELLQIETKTDIVANESLKKIILPQLSVICSDVFNGIIGISVWLGEGSNDAFSDICQSISQSTV